MPQIEGQVCPWCQTEIVWDPEIGPEDACPHCFNELGDYRSINLTVKPGEEPDDEEFDRTEDDDKYEDDYFGPDEYEEGVQHVLDRQEEAPECPSCRSFMLLAGTLTDPGAFVPFVHESVKRPLLNVSFSSQVYVCPSCFRVERRLSEADQLAMIELLKQVKP